MSAPAQAPILEDDPELLERVVATMREVQLGRRCCALHVAERADGRA